MAKFLALSVWALLPALSFSGRVGRVSKRVWDKAECWDLTYCCTSRKDKEDNWVTGTKDKAHKQL